MAKTKTPKPGKSKIKLESYQVLLKPLVTEKGMHQSTEYNQYAFEVNTLATKDDVRRAVEELFEVRVEKVRTQNRCGKPRRYRFRKGMTELEEGDGDSELRGPY